MKWVKLVFLVLFFCFTATHAHAQDDAGTEVDNDTGERNCIPAGEVEQSPGEETGLSEEGGATDGGLELPVCEEPDAATTVLDVEPPAVESEADEVPDAETADPEEEFEVDPEDEISEDYPVPLPSDI